MKIKGLLLGMFACAALASCTNNDLVEENQGGNQLDGNSFVHVSLVAPGTGNSRALGEFAPADENETGVSGATFLFLDGNFEGCADPFTTTEFTWEDTNSPTGAQLISDAILVINNDRVPPSYIVAVLNPTQEMRFSSSTSLKDLQEMCGEYKITEANKFIMSNSVYAADGKAVAAVSVNGKVFNSKDDALAPNNAVIIPVERVVAKVEVGGIPTVNLTDNANKVKVDNEELVLTVSVDGWQILENKESRLVKSIDADWQIGNWWNDADQYRSYWAQDYTGGGRTGYSWKEIDAADSRYAQETIGTTEENTNPYLLVKATIKQGQTPVSLVEYAGQKMTEEGYLNYVVSNTGLRNYYTKETKGDGDIYTGFTSSLLKMEATGANDYHAKAVLTAEAEKTTFYTVVKNSDGSVKSATPVDIKDVKDTVATMKEALYWNGGATYYTAPIEQHKAGDTSYYGIVRNHVYNINLKSLTGFGTPVADPDRVIDKPETPDHDETYLSAQIQILKWTMISQDVDLH